MLMKSTPFFRTAGSGDKNRPTGTHSQTLYMHLEQLQPTVSNCQLLSNPADPIRPGRITIQVRKTLL